MCEEDFTPIPADRSRDTSRGVRRGRRGCACFAQLIMPDGQIGKSVSSPLRKIFWFTFDPNHFYISSYPAPTRGAFRDRHGRWARDAMDAACQKTNDVARGRRSRVVLTPRRWCQVLEKQASWG